ncbi:MAG: PilW family protein [Moraxella sp.]|nr:PilW family protein [Moraxella sp.]
MQDNIQKGFTLIELMLSLVLGLIIMGAVIQVYFISVRTAAVQQAGSSVLDANVFGLQAIEGNIRMAGLGLSDVTKGNTSDSGVIVGNNAAVVMNGITPFDNTLISRDGAGPAHTQAGATNRGSDQLTIQYRAPTNMQDCEGNLALGPRRGIIDDDGSEETPIDGQIIIERYFVVDNNGTLELRCDAGRYVNENIIVDNQAASTNADIRAATTDLVNRANIIKDFNDNGVLVISGIDDFQIRYGVANGDGIRYVTPTQYNATLGSAVVAVQVGILTRGSVPTNQAPESPTYNILGEDVTMATGQGQYIRRVYESNIMLRNSRERS